MGKGREAGIEGGREGGREGRTIKIESCCMVRKTDTMDVIN